MHNPALYDAARAYVEVGLALLARCSSPGEGHTVRDETWVRANPVSFVRQTRQTWFPPTDKYTAELHAPPEYENLLTLLKNDTVIQPQIDTLVGSPFSKRRIGREDLTDGLIDRVAAAVGELRFDKSIFDKEYSAMESALYNLFIDHVFIAPLPNLSIEAPPVQVEPEIVLDTLTDEEIVACIRVGLIRNQFGDIPLVQVNWNYGIRFRYRLPKVIGEASPPAGDELQRIWTRREETLRSIDLALHLFKKGIIAAPGYLTYAVNRLMGGAIQLRMLQPVGLSPWFRPKCDLLANEVDSFLQLWKSLQSDGAKNNKALGNALRRFGYASERQRPEDRLVDLIIGAESLFLTDDKPELRGEQQYRISIRSALFIEMPGRSRRQIYNLMRSAYRTRNAIVHGGAPKEVDIKGSPSMELSQFTDTVEELMRSALKKAVAIAERNQEVDWEALTLSESS